MRHALLAVAIAVLAAACGPRCKSGHDAIVHVPARTGTTFVAVGRILVPITNTYPAHDEAIFVCDAYEVRQ